MTPRRSPGYFSVEKQTPLGSAVTKLMVYLVMAGSAQTHEIVICMPTAFGNRQDVMYFFSRGHSSFGIALLTVGVGGEVSVTDALPTVSVFFMYIR